MANIRGKTSSGEMNESGEGYKSDLIFFLLMLPWIFSARGSHCEPLKMRSVSGGCECWMSLAQFVSANTYWKVLRICTYVEQYGILYRKGSFLNHPPRVPVQAFSWWYKCRSCLESCFVSSLHQHCHWFGGLWLKGSLKGSSSSCWLNSWSFLGNWMYSMFCM